ncbi:nucleoside phosphorylase (5'-methylthioadenosine nucleosidase; S-adenosylhomocysteine nucleosidase) [Marinomonas sp. MED121]|mgnify:CR=1 FL=1|uniref:5'-methylthioadenosine/S-adenosylhomocysteine nucleosidase n=1 Tax=Marinomonas sp. MED121 TaxID=314277 RepID=UPI0000690BE9|nr:5'-methylthioadenosine/S-adenosylhomocysteine nucleosidase [Marinomonas sp. MED121]EAQ64955.1 nucleoside phosphorylase (5'-methylthioadenosine nucleosidase; S-adenosylhomocysteine nucleosidase) [Marinomonas sp. MED121]
MSLVGIIGAMEEEVALIKEWMTEVETLSIAGCEFYQGKLDGKEVVLLQSGIGKVNAAISTTLLLSKFAPSKVINIGSAGGYAEALNVGDVVISDQVCHHDVDVTVFGYAMGQVPGMPATYAADENLIADAKAAVTRLNLVQTQVGLIGTGDSFMQDPVRVEKVRGDFPTLLAVEMEAAAVAQVCVKFETPFVVVRALSDIAGKESSQSFEEFLVVAAKNSSAMVREMLTPSN